MIQQIKKDLPLIIVSISMLFVFAFFVPLTNVNTKIFFQIAYGSGGGGSAGGGASCSADAGAGSCAGAASSADGGVSLGGGSTSGYDIYGNACSVFTGWPCGLALDACGVYSDGITDCSGICLPIQPTTCGGPAPTPQPTPQAPQQPCSSAPNSCGLTQVGMGSAGSACPIPPPLDISCGDPGVTVGFTATVNSTVGNWEITSPRNSQIVSKGERCTIYWDASPATSCTVKGPGIDEPGPVPPHQVSPPGVSGVVQTPRIGIDTIGSSIYTITCKNGADKNKIVNSKFTCQLNPDYQEI